MFRIIDYIAVGLAGFLGAIIRALLGQLGKNWFSTPFPFSTLIINLTGGLVLSFFLNITLVRFRINPRLRLAFGTGFLGAYTTFSTFTLESINLLKENHLVMSFAYILATSFGCVFLAWVGAVLGRLLTEYKKDSKEFGESEPKGE